MLCRFMTICPIRFILKVHFRSLKESVDSFKEKEILQEKILKHLNLLHSFNDDKSDNANDVEIMDSMEDILTIYTNTELCIVRSLQKDPKRLEYTRIVKTVSQRIVTILHNQLKQNKCNILHVLLKITYNKQFPACKDIMSLLFR